MCIVLKAPLFASQYFYYSYVLAIYCWSKTSTETHRYYTTRERVKIYLYNILYVYTAHTHIYTDICRKGGWKKRFNSAHGLILKWCTLFYGIHLFFRGTERDREIGMVYLLHLRATGSQLLICNYCNYMFLRMCCVCEGLCVCLFACVRIFKHLNGIYILLEGHK